MLTREDALAEGKRRLKDAGLLKPSSRSSTGVEWMYDVKHLEGRAIKLGGGRRAPIDGFIPYDASTTAAATTTDAAKHVVTPVEEMLRQARPAGKTSDPRQQVEVAPRAAVAGYAYLLADEHDRVKIGAATDVLQRRADLQVGNADDLTILDVIATEDMFGLEAALKAHYRNARVRGEWFQRDAVEGKFGTEGLA